MKTTSDTFVTNKSLIVNAKDLKEAAWEDFYPLYFTYLYRIARSFHLDDATCKEIAAEIMAALPVKLQRFNHEGKPGQFRCWLSTIAENSIISRLRKKKVRRGVDASLERVHDAERATSTQNRIPDPNQVDFEQVSLREWQRSLTEAAIERVRIKVKPRNFQAFCLYQLEERPYDYIANKLSISITLLPLRVFRVRHAVISEAKNLEKELRRKEALR